MVEQLENEIKDLKAQAYDMESAFDKYKKDMEQRIADLSKKIADVKGNDKEAAVEPEVQQESVVEENAPVIVPEEQQDAAVATQIGENTETSSEPVINIETEVSSEPKSEVLPVIQPTPAPAEISSTPVLNVTPLVPNVDIHNTEMPKPEEAANKTVILKTDPNPAKAIVVTQEQFKNARGSEDFQKGIVLETAEMTTPAPVIPISEPVTTPVVNPIVEIPTGEQTVITPIVNSSSESVEAIDARMQELVDMLPTITDENKANQITAEVAALNEKKMLLTKQVA